jgi:hypothetical protein
MENYLYFDNTKEEETGLLEDMINLKENKLKSSFLRSYNKNDFPLSPYDGVAVKIDESIIRIFKNDLSIIDLPISSVIDSEKHKIKKVFPKLPCSDNLKSYIPNCEDFLIHECSVLLLLYEEINYKEIQDNIDLINFIREEIDSDFILFTKEEDFYMEKEDEDDDIPVLGFDELVLFLYNIDEKKDFYFLSDEIQISENMVSGIIEDQGYSLNKMKKLCLVKENEIFENKNGGFSCIIPVQIFLDSTVVYGFDY